MNPNPALETRPNGGPAHGKTLTLSEPLTLQSGVTLFPVTVAYETYGALNEERSNCVMVCHALTGDQYVASTHPITGNPGWWIDLVGPGKVIDTEKFFSELVNLRQAFAQLLLAEVAQVEMHDRAVRPIYRAALLLLLPERLA